MPTRTFNLRGVVDDETSTDITVTFNSNQVFTGAVNNTNKENPLCTFTADTSVSGEIATSVVNNGTSTVYVGPLDANYGVFENQTYTIEGSDEVHTYTADDVTSMFTSMLSGRGDSMKSVQINGVDSDCYGTESTGWVPVPVEAGETLTCTLTVDPIVVDPNA